jgi:hypothetical protein
MPGTNLKSWVNCVRRALILTILYPSFLLIFNQMTTLLLCRVFYDPSKEQPAVVKPET